MKAISTMLISLMITATRALAAGGVPEGEGLGLLASCFIGFGVLIVLFQFIPGVMLLVGMLKGIFTSEKKEAHEASTIK
jgi:uncharacterized membrane protein